MVFIKQEESTQEGRMMKQSYNLTEAHKEDLKFKGYTVVKNVLTAETCEEYVNEYKSWLSNFKDGWPSSKQSLIMDCNIGHADTTWKVRLAAHPVFTALWGTHKLLTSIDTIAIGRPPEEGKESFHSEGTHWFHTDQGASREGLHAYQGSMYLESADEDDWTFFVVEKSHCYLQEYYENNQKPAFRSSVNNYCPMSDYDIEWFLSKACKITRVAAPKGSLVLWDSRLVHANARPVRGRKNAGRWRFCVFVCMTPARWATNDDINDKKIAYKNACMTTHWASQDIRVGLPTPTDLPPEENKLWFRKLPAITETQMAKQLCGVLPYNFQDGQPNGPDWSPTWNEAFGDAPWKKRKEQRMKVLRKIGFCLFILLGVMSAFIYF